MTLPPNAASGPASCVWHEAVGELHALDRHLAVGRPGRARRAPRAGRSSTRRVLGVVLATARAASASDERGEGERAAHGGDRIGAAICCKTSTRRRGAGAAPCSDRPGDKEVTPVIHLAAVAGSHAGATRRSGSARTAGGSATTSAARVRGVRARACSCAPTRRAAIARRGVPDRARRRARQRRERRGRADARPARRLVGQPLLRAARSREDEACWPRGRAGGGGRRPAPRDVRRALETRQASRSRRRSPRAAHPPRGAGACSATDVTRKPAATARSTRRHKWAMTEENGARRTLRGFAN